MPLISIITPCFNEEDNVELIHERVREVFAALPGYDYEHLFIDNASQDRTVAILREIAARDSNVKVIVNARNFGHLRSPYYGLLQSTGDAAMIVAADLEDPPELIPQFVEKWAEGYKITIGVKVGSEESWLFRLVRSAYYAIIGRLAEVRLVPNFMGFGLYDRQVLEVLREIDDPYPYLRGLIVDIGFERAEIPYTKPSRKRGFSKNSFYALYDTAMLGIVSYSKVPLRLATLSGFFVAGFSFLIAMAYLVYKLIHWNEFTLGLAPLVIGIFFFSSVQLIFLGIVGEYVGAIYTQVQHRPLVVEAERINFDGE
jgi:polyisoprenyl-phosphate glycosyltransferase